MFYFFPAQCEFYFFPFSEHGCLFRHGPATLENNHRNGPAFLWLRTRRSLANAIAIERVSPEWTRIRHIKKGFEIVSPRLRCESEHLAKLFRTVDWILMPHVSWSWPEWNPMATCLCYCWLASGKGEINHINFTTYIEVSATTESSPHKS